MIPLTPQYKTPHHTINQIQSKLKLPQNINIMDKFFNHHFDSNTTFIESAPPQKIPIHKVETIIQNGLNYRTTHKPNQTSTIDAAIIQNIIETGQNPYKINTYEGTPFQSILLLKQENTFDTKQFCLACISNFITPYMITKYSILQLIHYAYIIAINPRAISNICKTSTVDLGHDYYKDLFGIQHNNKYIKQHEHHNLR